MVRFNRDDLCLRPQSFYREGHTGDQSRAPDRDDDKIDIGNLFHDLQSDCALTSNDGQIVVAIDVGQAFFFRDLVRARLGFAEIVSVQDHIGAEFLAVVYLNQRGEFWHDHSCGNTEQLSLIGERLRVIASRSGDDAALLLIRRKLNQGVARAALLEASSALQVLEFAENSHTGEVAEWNGMRTGR